MLHVFIYLKQFSNLQRYRLGFACRGHFLELFDLVGLPHIFFSYHLILQAVLEDTFVVIELKVAHTP